MFLFNYNGILAEFSFQKVFDQDNLRTAALVLPRRSIAPRISQHYAPPGRATCVTDMHGPPMTEVKIIIPCPFFSISSYSPFSSPFYTENGAVGRCAQATRAIPAAGNNEQPRRTASGSKSVFRCIDFSHFSQISACLQIGSLFLIVTSDTGMEA